MSMYVYCPRPSQGALDLVTALGATRLRKFDGMDFWRRGRRVRLGDDDSVVCWGSHVPEIEGVKVLNSSGNRIDKLAELHSLSVAGVRTISARTFEYDDYERAKEIGWLPRVDNHQGGLDLLNPPRKPDYWVAKSNFASEYRIHSFRGKSIRAGVKVVRDGFTLVGADKDWKPNSNLAHPWIRSYDGGWRVKYDGFQSTAPLRNIASKAVKALGLQFGAVDIGVSVEGVLTVLEVNRAPGIENNTIGSYTRAILRWVKETENDLGRDGTGPEDSEDQ